MTMKKILVTGGTVFVSRYIAEYYVSYGHDVYVLNRNTRKQSNGVKLIEADRHNLGETLKEFHFDVIIDTAYTENDVSLLLDAVGSYNDYIFISSSAVYPEYGVQPFKEQSQLALNIHWQQYGTNKIKAEKILLSRNPKAYIIRPPYLYGPMNNVYREAFIFDCAMQNRPFYLPKDGEMQLHFYHVKDMCKFIDIILETQPKQHIFNVGNNETISIADWVKICYDVVGKNVEFVNIHDDTEQRNYFSFYDYEYTLDVSKQCELINDTISLENGIKECFSWYKHNSDKVNKKPFIDYIDTHFSLIK